MDKLKAIELLGGTVPKAAAAVGVSYQAIKQWPANLPPRIADRVLAAVARQHLPELLADTKSLPKAKRAKASKVAEVTHG